MRNNAVHEGKTKKQHFRLKKCPQFVEEQLPGQLYHLSKALCGTHFQRGRGGD